MGDIKVQLAEEAEADRLLEIQNTGAIEEQSSLGGGFFSFFVGRRSRAAAILTAAADVRCEHGASGKRQAGSGELGSRCTTLVSATHVRPPHNRMLRMMTVQPLAAPESSDAYAVSYVTYRMVNNVEHVSVNESP